MTEDLTGWHELTHREELALAYDCIPSVDLSLGFSPVIGHHRDEPVEAMRTQGRGYIIIYRSEGALPYTEHVSEAGLKLQRARYLVRRGYYGLYMPESPYYAKGQIVRAYFNGYFLPIPESRLPEMRQQWRLYLRDVLSRPAPTSNVIEGMLLAKILDLPMPSGEVPHEEQ